MDRPNAVAAWVNAPALRTEAYNLRTDYDADGNRLPSAQPVVTSYKNCQALLSALNVSVCFDVKSQVELKAKLDEASQYIKALKSKCAERCWGM